LLFALFGVIGNAAFAQKISLDFGLKTGVPLTKPVGLPIVFTTTTGSVERSRYIAGPTLVMVLDDRFAVELDGLYRPIRFQTTDADPTSAGFEFTRAHSVEVPLFASYRFRVAALRPFAGAGLILYDRVWGKTDARRILHDQGDRETHVIFHYGPFRSEGSAPFLLGGGFDLAASSLTIGPELRYTHWGRSTVRRPHQWDFLISITHPTFRLGRW
jgi:hypothetical protein